MTVKEDASAHLQTHILTAQRNVNGAATGIETQMNSSNVLLMNLKHVISDVLLQTVLCSKNAAAMVMILQKIPVYVTGIIHIMDLVDAIIAAVTIEVLSLHISAVIQMDTLN